MLKRALACVVILVCLAPLLAQSSAPEFPSDNVLNGIRPEHIRAHMEFLASDLLEGRGTGSRGYQIAAEYVRTQFEEMGLGRWKRRQLFSAGSVSQN